MSRKQSTYVPKDPLIHKFMFNTGFLGCFVIILWPIIVLPFLPFFCVVTHWRRKQFRDVLKNSDRLLSWPDFIAQVDENKGTVIIEVGNKATTRFWWTPDDILLCAPMAPPELDDLDIIAYGGANQHDFIKWCYENYTSHQTGSALLIYPVEAEYRTFPFETCKQKMVNKFPNQQVVVLTFYDTRYI